MNYILNPSLKHRSFVKIATTLWNQNDTMDLTSKFYFSSPTLNIGERKKEWQKVESEVIKKVLKLPLPKSLKKELSSFVEAVGWQILTWIDFHDNCCNFVMKLPNEFFWTPQGTIDKEKTAQMLVQDKNLDIVRRYRLACTYCLEDYIFILWNQLSGKKLYGKDLRKIRINESPLVSFWSHDIEGEIVHLDNIMRRYCQDDSVTPYEYAFQRSAINGNEAATRYFLKKLTSEEKKRVLVKTAGYVANRRCDCISERTDFPREHYADVLCFLLSQMDEGQQIEVFKSYPRKVLKCFLDWPWQNLFMETATRMLNFLSEEDCRYFLREMVDKVIEGHKDYDYQKLFGKFWQQSPNAHKRYVIDECSSGFLLSKLLKIKDEKNIKLILKDATLIEKEKLIFCDRGKDVCQGLIYGGEWDLFEFFIRECVPSKNKVIKFKEEFEERITWCCSKEELVRNKDKWDKFFQLLDNFINEYDNKKRSMEEGEGSPAKKLCSIEFKEVAHSMKK